MRALKVSCKKEGPNLVAKLLGTREEAAEALSVSQRQIDNFIANGELVSRKCGRRRLVLWKSVEEFARRDHGSPAMSGSQAVAD